MPRPAHLLAALLATFALTPALHGTSRPTPNATQTAPGSVKRTLKLSATNGGLAIPLQDGDQFGRGSAAIGDVDGDGITDLVVGAHGDDDGGTQGATSDVGAAWIVYLNANGSARGHAKISAQSGGLPGELQDRDNFGRAVSRLGDLDGDGTPDLAVGANRDDDGGSNHGAVYVLFLNPSGSVRDYEKISDTRGGFTGVLADNDEFGRALEPLGDLDGDGVVDLAVGAPLDDDGGAETGALWVLFLNSDGTVKGHTKLSETTGATGMPLGSADSFGMSVTCLGDLDADGVVDLAVGTPKDDDGGPRKGTVWILFLRSDGSAKAWQKISEAAGGFTGSLYPSEEFGTAVANLGDLDGDGLPDLAVGAILDDEGGNDKGAVWILFLNADGTVKGHQKINETNGGFGAPLDLSDWFGSSVDGVGDFDGDGVPDLLVGARFDDDGGKDKGAVYLLPLNGVSRPSLTAEFDATPTTGTAPLAVAFTDRSSGPVRTWTWDFGDGDTASTRSPTHVYTSGGTYTVALTVGEVTQADTETKSALVHVDHGPPSAAFDRTPASGEAPLTVLFADLSQGAVSAHAWDFGDGASASAASPTHAYALPGTYTVTLTVSGPGGSDTATWFDAVVVDEPPPAPPAADFLGAPTSGEAPLDVSFADFSSGAVEAWAWDFGDGATSSSDAPSHTYAAPGTYTLSLSVTGPGGSDTETKAGYVSVTAPPAPNAGFAAAPLLGAAPLSVLFTDQTTGQAHAWAWDFGDGASASLQDPAHAYAQPGTYSVSLTAQGIGGSDTETRTALVQVVTPGPLDPSFEAQFAGMQPSAPWVPFGGAAHVVRSSASQAEVGFPPDGLHWLDLSAEGTSDATPPSNPGGATLPPLGGTGVSQSFRVAPGRGALRFDVAFLRDGAASDPARNDWMSVDVSDGVTTVNLWYADGFTPTPNVSLVHGLAMTEVERVLGDLHALFPSAGAETLFTLSVQVGNGGDDLAPSHGFVDHFLVGVPAGAVPRNGSGVNAACFASVNAPLVGATWTSTVDASAHPGASLTLVIAYDRPQGGILTPYGELLIATEPFGGVFAFASLVPSGGGVATHDVLAPDDLSFVGTALHAQAVLLGGAGPELCNALDLVLGI